MGKVLKTLGVFASIAAQVTGDAATYEFSAYPKKESVSQLLLHHVHPEEAAYTEQEPILTGFKQKWPIIQNWVKYCRNVTCLLPDPATELFVRVLWAGSSFNLDATVQDSPQSYTEHRTTEMGIWKHGSLWFLYSKGWPGPNGVNMVQLVQVHDYMSCRHWDRDGAPEEKSKLMKKTRADTTGKLSDCLRTCLQYTKNYTTLNDCRVFNAQYMHQVTLARHLSLEAANSSPMSSGSHITVSTSNVNKASAILRAHHLHKRIAEYLFDHEDC
ncbi:hypothetical protein C8R44DRAFT_754673 [Mycena epipterygia]|nr:hypothetical protein C8R44DRAFT_754673 [Mycena epipterygia]